MNYCCQKSGILSIWRREVLLFFHNKLKLFTSFFVPVFLVIVLGRGLTSIIPFSDMGFDFEKFLYSGVLVLSILVAVFDSMISLVLDRETGFMRELSVSPLSKTGIAFGKILGATTRGVIQGILVLSVAGFVDIIFTFPFLINVLLIILLISFGSACFAFLMTSMIDRVETFSFVSQIILSPTAFLSGAFFPLTRMPDWLQKFSLVNPVFYFVNLMRNVLFHNVFISSKAVNVSYYSFEFSLIMSLLVTVICLSLALIMFNNKK